MLEAMTRHNWPGNVRELQNVLQRYRSLNRFDLLKGAPRQPVQKADTIAGLPIDAQGESFQAAMARCERQLLLKVLENNQWQREAAAQVLGLPLRTFYRKLKKNGMIRHKKCQ
jgi:DNA-binding NtrC family response regulator